MIGCCIAFAKGKLYLRPASCYCTMQVAWHFIIIDKQCDCRVSAYPCMGLDFALPIASRKSDESFQGECCWTIIGSFGRMQFIRNSWVDRDGRGFEHVFVRARMGEIFHIAIYVARPWLCKHLRSSTECQPCL